MDVSEGKVKPIHGQYFGQPVTTHMWAGQKISFIIGDAVQKSRMFEAPENGYAL